MGTIIYHNELVKRAIVYLEQSLVERPEARKADLLDDACMRFNLSPADASALERLFYERLAKR